MRVASDLLAELRAATPQMVEQLGELVRAESPSADRAATAACAAVVADLGLRLLGQEPEVLTVDGHAHLRWRLGSQQGRDPAKVVLVGHFDTVWPLGTLARWPYAVVDGQATGPGVFDMKAGIVQMFHALAHLSERDGVVCLLNSDEETGSLTSREMIEETVAGADAVLVLEPSAAGALKVARKGTSMYEVHVAGRAAHAGNEPERGANATVELAHQVLSVASLGRPEVGTTVTPTVAAAGTTTNTVPADGVLHIDVRALTGAEQERVDAAMRRLAPAIAGTSLHVQGGPNRPPFDRSMSAGLLEVAARVAADLGLPPLEAVEVGGGSDGNFTAALGVPTLDGLGAVGANLHAEGEHVLIGAMAERAALVAGLVSTLVRT